jgi:Family of unknown function (DUF6889)
LPGGEDYVLNPVLAGMCKYESLKDGALDLFDISLMNDALTVKAENERRLSEASQK